MPESPLQRAARQRAAEGEKQRAAADAHLAPVLAFAEQANAAAAEFVTKAPEQLFESVPTTPVRMRSKGVFTKKWVAVGDPSTLPLVAIALESGDPEDRWSGPVIWALDRVGGWWTVAKYEPEVLGYSASAPPRRWMAEARSAEEMGGLMLEIAETAGGRNQRHLWSEGRWDEIALALGVRLLEILDGRVIYELGNLR